MRINKVINGEYRVLVEMVIEIKCCLLITVGEDGRRNEGMN